MIATILALSLAAAPIEVMDVPEGRAAQCQFADGCVMLTRPGLLELMHRLFKQGREGCGKSL